MSSTPEATETLNTPLRLVRIVVLLGFALTGLFGLWVIFFHLNTLQIDAAGHIASAWTLREGFFHQHYDGFFLGTIANLSYPPLEDAILAAFGLFVGGDLFAAYPLYLGTLLVAYLGALIRLGHVFRSEAARVFFLLVSLFLLHVDKPGLTYFQGLSLIDLLVTGLAAEVLSFVFFLLLLVDLIHGRPWLRVALWLFLAISSHLVVGPASLLLVLVYAGVCRRVDWLGSVGLALLSASYFLLPFLEARSQFFASTIYKPHPYFMPTLTVFAILLLMHHRRFLPAALASLLIALPTELHQLFTRWFGEPLLPAYHYYRLAILSLFLLVVATAALLDRYGEPKETAKAPARDRTAERVTMVLAGLLLAFLFRDFRPHSFDLGSHQYTKPPLSSELTLPASEEMRRVFVIHPERPCDFYLDSFFVARDSPASFVKGLYWESSRNHTLLSSYLATLQSTSALVLDYWYYTSPSCPELQCFFDHFARDFNIGWVLAPRSVAPTYLDESRIACTNRILGQGTRSFEITRQSGGSVAGRPYDLYALEPREGGESHRLSHRIIESIALEDLRSVEDEDPQFFSSVMEAVFEACGRGEISPEVFLFESDYRRLQREVAGRASGDFDPAPAGVRVSLRKTGMGEYAVRVEADRPVLFRVKLSYFPGFELVQEDGEGPLPLYDAAGSMIGIGHGEMVLRYRRTAVMKTGHTISLATLGLVPLLGVVSWRRRRSRQRNGAIEPSS